MTRPKKEATLAKTKDVHLRMNKIEYAILTERAKANDMTVSDFVRNALNNQKVIIKYEITVDVPEGAFRYFKYTLILLAQSLPLHSECYLQLQPTPSGHELLISL